MYHVSTQAVDERMINVHYYYESEKRRKKLTSNCSLFLSAVLDAQCIEESSGPQLLTNVLLSVNVTTNSESLWGVLALEVELEDVEPLHSG